MYIVVHYINIVYGQVRRFPLALDWLGPLEQFVITKPRDATVVENPLWLVVPLRGQALEGGEERFIGLVVVNSQVHGLTVEGGPSESPEPLRNLILLDGLVCYHPPWGGFVGWVVPILAVPV